MCGIIGSRNALKIGNRKKALNFLRLRGPENEGEYFDMDNNVWLGHTRLSIRSL